MGGGGHKGRAVTLVMHHCLCRLRILALHVFLLVLTGTLVPCLEWRWCDAGRNTGLQAQGSQCQPNMRENQLNK